MLYSKLADTYERLEKTSGRLDKTAIIAELLKEAKTEELEKVSLLVQGVVFPSWNEKEIGVAKKMVIKIISVATGFHDSEIGNRYNKIGDLGLVVEELVSKKKQQTLLQKHLTVEKVFENLQKLAEIEGTGSQEIKISLVSELISFAKPKEAKYIVRTVLEELRIGVAEGVLRDAIGKAFEVSPTDVENAWFILPDYGEVAKIAKEKGEKGLKNVEISLGTPINVLLAEKSPSLEEALNTFDNVALEFKYDGMRCITGNTPLYIKGKGLISVKDVKVGDKVLSHKGIYREVEAKNKRTIDKEERIFKFQTFLGNEFKITEGHRILVSFKDHIGWTLVEDIKNNSEIVFPIPKAFSNLKPPKLLSLKTVDGYKKKIKLDNFFYRFLGYWIGDGYSNTYNKTFRIGLIFNAKTERDICNYYKKNIVKKFGITNISENFHNGAVYLYWTDKPLLFWLSKNFRRRERRDWRGKTLPDWFWNISKDNFIQFLKGYMEANGYEDKLNRKNINTKENFLATYIQFLALKFGIIIGVKRLRIKGREYYRLILTKSNRYARIFNNKLFIKILKKDELSRHNPRGIDPRTIVYNLQVDKDESYCTSLAALHNCLIHRKGDKVWIFTRRLEDVTDAFPDIVELMKKNLKADNCILDSEAVGLDPKTNKLQPFQVLSTRIKRKYDVEKTSKEIPIKMNLFDILFLDKKSLFDSSLKERYEILKKSFKPVEGKLQLAEHLETKDLKEAEKFYKKSLNEGNEGLIVKNLDAKYQPGRRVSGGWLKVKPTMENLDLVIVGGIWGTGKRTGWIGSLILGCRDEKTGKFLECGMMGTGIKEKKENEGDLTFDELTKMLKPLIVEEKENQVTVKPKIVIEVAYEEIQKSPTYSSGYALRFPRFIKERTFEKPANKCDTLERIETLFNQQKKRS